VVAHVLRLRAALLLGALRGNRRTVLRTTTGIVLLAVATVAACVAVLSLSKASWDVARVVVVLGGAGVTLGFALAPLIAGVEDQLDPRRFAVFGLGGRPLAGTLALAGLISAPTLALVAVGVCTTILWAGRGVSPVVGAIAAVLAVITCDLLARVCMALAALFLSERRSRELSGLFILAIVVVVVPVAVFFASLEWHGTVPSQLSQAVAVVGYTPFGAAWALPAAVAGGSAGVWLNAVVAVATPVLLGLAWLWLVQRLLSTTERPIAVRERGGLGWFAVAPGTPGGAIAARSLVYWLRDRRYLVNAVVIPIAAIIAVVPPLVAGVSPATVALIPVPIVALFFGWLPHNDLAYDSTAVWLHIASGTRGVSDRIGRLVPILLIGIPVLAITIPLAISLHGRWALLPAMVGVCASLFLGGLGLSSIASAVAPYAVSRPGESPFQQPERVGSSGAIAQSVVLVGAIVVAAPALWWGWLAMTRDISYATVAMWGGAAIGLLVLAAGVAVGSFAFERRGGRLMEFAESA
jgi:ABC-2 type transport system permease protein